MDLSTAANWAQIISLVTIVGGGGFALFQIRQSNRLRADQAAIEMIRSLQGPEVIDEMYQFLNHANLTAAQIRSNPALERAALHSVFVLETLGVMVHERVLRLDVLDRMFGGFIRHVWAKIRPWAQEERRRTGVINHAEWVEWLVDQLTAHPDPSKPVGAYVAYRAWKP
jgi:hypothetical protein